tara:strand:+ start:1662 stop:3017 length:1356 start_codon:yes stop_codon:yes gene_type:complete
MYLNKVKSAQLYPYWLLLVIVIFLSNCSTANDDNSAIDLENIIPNIEISTSGNTILDEPKINANIMVYADDVTLYQGNIAIETRGSSSIGFPKNSYSFETRNENNEDLDVSLLEFPEEEDWILNGPYSDKTLMRNMLMYDLSRDIDRYASRSAFVELSINEELQGVYILLEKLKRGPDRIDIDKLNPDENSGEDITGGYIIKIDRTDGAGSFFTSSFDPPFATEGQKMNFVFEYPDPDEITSQQKNYITNYISSFESTLASDDFADPVNGYLKYIDVSSFIDFFLMNELANNVDAYRLSTFIHKEKNEKLAMGPIWDFNYALGNVDYCNSGDTNVWAYKFNERCGNHYQQVPFWWSKLLQDPAFVTQLQERWTKLRSNQFSESKIMAKIDAYATLLQETGAVDKNFSVWEVLGVYVRPNNYVGETHQQEVDYLKEWIENRLLWLDSSISNM